MKKFNYEAKKAICVTPCPYKPDVKIGSGACVTCPYHVNRDTEKKLVFCRYLAKEKDENK